MTQRMADEKNKKKKKLVEGLIIKDFKLSTQLDIVGLDNFICASHDSHACMVQSVTLHSWWLQNKGNFLQPQFYSSLASGTISVKTSMKVHTYTPREEDIQF